MKVLLQVVALLKYIQYKILILSTVHPKNTLDATVYAYGLFFQPSIKLTEGYLKHFTFYNLILTYVPFFTPPSSFHSNVYLMMVLDDLSKDHQSFYNLSCIGIWMCVPNVVIHAILELLQSETKMSTFWWRKRKSLGNYQVIRVRSLETVPNLMLIHSVEFEIIYIIL